MLHKNNNIDPNKVKPDLSSVEGISNIALWVSSIAGSHSIFANQNKRGGIENDLLTYQNCIFIKSLLTDLSRKLMSRKHSGLSRMQQNLLKKSVERMRYLGLLPYVK